MVLAVKNQPAKAGDIRDAGFIPGSEDPLEDSMATHSTILAWTIPWTEEPGRLQSTGSHRVGLDRSDLAHTHANRQNTRWRKRWARCLKRPFLARGRAGAEGQHSPGVSKGEESSVGPEQQWTWPIKDTHVNSLERSMTNLDPQNS